MIMPDGSLRCDNCGKEILLKVSLQEGSLNYYCPRCHHYEEIRASTTTVYGEGLTKEKNYGSLSSNTF